MGKARGGARTCLWVAQWFWHQWSVRTAVSGDQSHPKQIGESNLQLCLWTEKPEVTWISSPKPRTPLPSVNHVSHMPSAIFIHSIHGVIPHVAPGDITNRGLGTTFMYPLDIKEGPIEFLTVGQRQTLANDILCSIESCVVVTTEQNTTWCPYLLNSSKTSKSL